MNRELYSKAVEAYDNGNPIMSDEEFDKLEQSIEEETRTFGGNGDFPHVVPMKSLSKSMTIEEASSFILNSLKKSIVHYSPKLDGMSGEVLVRFNKVERVLTRGDGEKGSNITETSKSIVERCLDLNGFIKMFRSIRLRGEFIIQKKYFQEINDYLISVNQEPVTSLRNAVSGFLKRKELDDNLLKYIEFIPYILLSEDGKMFCNFSDGFEKIFCFLNPSRVALPIFYNKSWSGKIKDESIDFQEFFNSYTQRRDSFPYEIDGVVLKLDDIKAFIDEGETSHHPKGATAWKFPAEVKQVQIQGYEWSISTKSISPVAIIHSTYLDGAMISRIAMHSLNNIIKCQAYIGNTVSLVRSGGVIPKISYSIEESTDLTSRDLKEFIDSDESLKDLFLEKIQFPKVCPSCNSEIEINSNMTKISCKNSNCPERLSSRLEVFAKAVGIEEIGSETAKELVRLGVKLPSDLWSLTRERLQKESILNTEKVISNLLSQIYEIREVSEVKLLSSLSIDMMGVEVATKLLRSSGGLQKLKTLDFESFEMISPYHEDVSEVIYSSFISMIPEIERLEQRLLVKPLVTTDQSLQGINIVITGETSRRREEWKSIIESKGGKLNSSVSKKTTYLVTNSTDMTSKMRDALKLGVKILTETELQSLVMNRESLS